MEIRNIRDEMISSLNCSITASINLKTGSSEKFQQKAIKCITQIAL